MSIAERNYYYTVTGGNDNTLEKVLRNHGIRKSDGSEYNTNYRHDPEAWNYIRSASTENAELLTDPKIWRGQSNEKRLAEWKIDESSDSPEEVTRKKNAIRRWCRSDVNPPASAALEDFWDNELCRFYARASASHTYHLIIYRGEQIWIPAEETTPTEETPPAEEEIETIRHELTDEELKTGFKPEYRKRYKLIFPLFRMQLDKSPGTILEEAEKFTLYSTDDEKWYKKTYGIEDNLSDDENVVEIHFQGIRSDLEYTLETMLKGGKKHENFAAVSGKKLIEDSKKSWTIFGDDGE